MPARHVVDAVRAVPARQARECRDRERGRRAAAAGDQLPVGGNLIGIARPPVFALLGRVRQSGHSNTQRAGVVSLALVGISLAGAIGPSLTWLLKNVGPRLPIAVNALSLAVAGLWALRAEASLSPIDTAPLTGTTQNVHRRRCVAVGRLFLGRRPDRAGTGGAPRSARRVHRVRIRRHGERPERTGRRTRAVRRGVGRLHDRDVHHRGVAVRRSRGAHGAGTASGLLVLVVRRFWRPRLV